MPYEPLLLNDQAGVPSALYRRTDMPASSHDEVWYQLPAGSNAIPVTHLVALVGPCGGFPVFPTLGRACGFTLLNRARYSYWPAATGWPKSSLPSHASGRLPGATGSAECSVRTSSPRASKIAALSVDPAGTSTVA